MNVIPQNQPGPRKKPPVFIVIIAVVFLAAGLLDLWRAAGPLASSPRHLASDTLEVLIIGATALLGGIYLIKGRNWARWLLAVWMALHVALSIGDLRMLLAHLVIFGLILSGLFYPAASTYFRPPRGI